MKKILTACLSLLMAIAAQAQGSWIAPEFPGAEMPAGADGTTVYGLCNVEAGAFALAGMNWSTHAISQRLLNGETSLPNEQKVKVTNSNGKLKFTINGKTFLGGGTGVNDLWVDHAQNNEWTPTEVAKGVYKLSNAGGDLDLLWKNGGPLTPNGGVGKTKWGLIKESDIVNGKYSLYKAKVQLYELYKACSDAGCVEVYPDAFATALAAYNASDATAASIQAAYVTLFKAVYMAVDDRTTIDASPLFTNADMCASGKTTGWGEERSISWSVFERWHASNFKQEQTQTLPAGKYSATLHAFWRQDGSQAGPTFAIASGDNSSVKNVKAMTDVDFGTVAGNGGGFKDNKPDNMRSGGVAIAHGDLEYSTDFISVSEGKPVTITLSMPAGDQWLLWQDVKLTYKGMTDAELVAMMADKIAVAEALAGEQLDPEVLTALNNAIEQASGGTRAQILQSGPVLDAAIDAARANITAREEARQLLVAALERFEADFNDGENGALRKMSAEAWTNLLNVTMTASYIKDFGKNIGSETVLTVAEIATAAETYNAAMDTAEADIALYAYDLAHEAAVALQDGSSLAIASALAEYTATTHEQAIAAGYDLEQAIAVLNNAVTMAEASDNATSLIANPQFADGTAGWTHYETIEGYNDVSIKSDGPMKQFNVWGDKIKYSDLYQQLQNLPNGTYELTANFQTYTAENRKTVGNGKRSTDGFSWISLYADNFDESGAPRMMRSNNIGHGEGLEDDARHDYTVYIKVVNNKANIGVRSDYTYYRVTDFRLQMVDADAHKADVAKAVIYAALFNPETANSTLEFNLSDAKYADAENVDLRTGGFVQAANALVKASKTGQIAGNNVIVGGVCDNLVLTDKAPFANSAEFTATAATYERTMANEWGTVMLPYEVSSDANVKFYTLSNVNAEEGGTMTFTEAETLPAGTPGVFVKQDENATSVALNGSNVSVEADGDGTLETSVTGWELIGTYKQKNFSTEDTEANNLYFISDNKFWKSTGTLAVAPFRAYFKSTVSSGAKAFRLVIEDTDTTEVKLITDDVLATKVIYTLDGIRINDAKNLKSGIYIINGKKTAVK